MSSRNKDERAHVNALIKAIVQNSPRYVHAHIDRDAGNVRHTSSGWDFLLTIDSRVVFCEAKEGTGKLSDWQSFAHAQIQACGSPYKVVRFWHDGECFSVDDGPMVETDKASMFDFFSL